MKRFLLAILAVITVCVLAQPASAQIRQYRGGQDTDAVWLVVASNFTGAIRGGARVKLCSGANDQVKIQEAVDEAYASGRSGAIVQLSPGTFTVSKPTDAVDIVFTADLTDGVAKAVLTNLSFSEGEAGDLAVGQVFRVSGGADNDGGESVEDNLSDCIVTLKQITGGYEIGEDFNNKNYTTAGSGTPVTFVRLIGAIQLKGYVILRASGLGTTTTLQLADDQNCTVVTKEDATPDARTVGGGIENIDIRGNRTNQGDHSAATYHPECNGIVINDDSWDFHIRQISLWHMKGDGVWFCNSWGQQMYGGGWIENCSGSGLVFGNGTVATVKDIKIADVGDATNRDAHASNDCPGDGAVFTVAGIRLHWSQRCIISPSLVESNQHWAIFGLQVHNSVISNAIIQVSNAGAAAEGGIRLDASTRNVIEGCHFDITQDGATGIKPGGFKFTISNNTFLDTNAITPIDWSAASGMNNSQGNVNGSPYAVSLGDKATLLPRSPQVELTCTAAGGTIGLSETYIVENTPVTIVNVGTNACTLTDEAGVKELAGNAVLTQYDTLTIVYIGDRWVELSRSDND